MASVGFTVFNKFSQNTNRELKFLSKNSPKTCLSCFQPHVKSLLGSAVHSEQSYFTVKNTGPWHICLVHQHTVPQALSKAASAAGAISRTSEGGSHSHRKSTVIPEYMHSNSPQAAHNKSAHKWHSFSFSALWSYFSTSVASF